MGLAGCWRRRQGRLHPQGSVALTRRAFPEVADHGVGGSRHPHPGLSSLSSAIYLPRPLSARLGADTVSIQFRVGQCVSASAGC